MVAAHRGVEIKELTGVGMGERLPPQAAPATVSANGGAKGAEPGPAAPPVLTKRGADVLVQLEKLLDDAAKADKTTTAEPPKPAKPVSSSAIPFPDSFAAAAPDNAAPAPRKN
jgi:penicillin-binding protein 1A